jgi:RNA polymerase sigma factor for flagellar operon FliA
MARMPETDGPVTLREPGHGRDLAARRGPRHTDEHAPTDELARRRALVEANVALVEHIVNRLLNRLSGRHDREELVRVGALGLVEAASRYDATRNIPFATFAGLRIEGAILDHLRSTDWMPRGLRQWEREILRVERALEESLGRTPTDAEVAAAMDVTVARLQRLRRRIHPADVDSLDRPVGEAASELCLGDTIADPRPGVADDLDDRELRAYVRECLGLLSERHRVVVVGCLLEGRTLREMAELLGITRSRVAQLKDDALALIRDAVEAQYRDPDDVAPETRRRSRGAAMAAQLAQRAALHQRSARLAMQAEAGGAASDAEREAPAC